MRAGDYFPWLEEQMLAGRTVVASSLDELPKEADVDRLNLSLFGVRSNLTVPLAVGGQTPIGALGFNSTHGERDWPEPLIARLKLVAQIFAGALARRRDDAALRESQERLALALDSAEAGPWSLDYGTRDLLAVRAGTHDHSASRPTRSSPWTRCVLACTRTTGLSSRTPSTGARGAVS